MQSNKLLGGRLHEVGLAVRPAIVNLQVVILCPPQVLKSLFEGCGLRLTSGVVSGTPMRTPIRRSGSHCCARPRDRRATRAGDELPPLHLYPLAAKEMPQDYQSAAHAASSCCIATARIRHGRCGSRSGVYRTSCASPQYPRQETVSLRRRKCTPCAITRRDVSGTCWSAGWRSSLRARAATTAPRRDRVSGRS